MPIGLKDCNASSMKKKDEPHTNPRAIKAGSHDNGFVTPLGCATTQVKHIRRRRRARRARGAYKYPNSPESA